MLIKTEQLTGLQLEHLGSLLQACKKQDGHIIPVYPHILEQKRRKPYNFLYYQEKQLVGFASVFFFYETACEVALVIKPSHRRKNIATRLLKQLLVHIDNTTINTVIFSKAHEADSSWMLKQNFCFLHSEYEMERTGRERAFAVRKDLGIHKATSVDVPFLCAINEACFADQNATSMPGRFYALLQDDCYTIVVACVDGLAIAKAHLHWQKNGVRLSDIAVWPTMQGIGYGQSLIAHCINQVLQKKETRLFLDVETTNCNALKLYKNLGFQTRNVCDYWSIAINSLPLGAQC